MTASGRASKMTASRPSGQLTFSSSRPVVEFGAVENAADGIGQSGDGAHAGDHGLQACAAESFRRSTRACDRFAAAAAPLRASPRVFGVGGKDFGRGAFERARDGFERVVALLDGARRRCIARSLLGGFASARTASLTCAFPGKKRVPTGFAGAECVENAGRAAVGDYGGPAGFVGDAHGFELGFHAAAPAAIAAAGVSRGHARRRRVDSGIRVAPWACGSPV